MTASPTPSDGSALCTSCGLCCDGTLFNRAVSKPEEVDQLAAFGITAVTIGEKVRFPLPCHLLDGASCTIYEHRFHICRSFRCKLLNRHLNGNIGLEAAQRVVVTARTQAAAAAELDPEAATMRGRTEIRRAQVGWTGTKDPEMRLVRARLMFAITMLDEYLDTHFRRRPDGRPAGQSGERA